MTTRIGIDSGGTFTDLITIDELNGRITASKTASTPNEPLKALKKILTGATIDAHTVTRLILGTTITTNAIIQRKGAKVLFLGTSGIEDLLELQTSNRPRNYDLLWRRPVPLIKRRWCLGVEERISHDGNIIVPLSKTTMHKVASKIDALIKQYGMNAIAISFLFSYINPTHEKEMEDYLTETFPGLPLSASHKVAPVWREYERSNTTVADAFVKPIITKYVFDAQHAFESIGVSGAHCLIKSNGGTTLLDVVPERPVDTLLSGLAAGVIAGRYFGSLVGQQNCVTFDMGGTSCDVGLIVNGKPGFTANFEIEWGLPISNSVVDVRTVGAGGDSIGWVDKGGFLRVGPQSAGAEPGPACYGSGSLNATVTDANLALGRLSSASFLGGTMKLNQALAEKALEQLGNKANLPIKQTAFNIVQLVNDNMAGTIRLITVEKGIDPREFTLVAFGGAGALHACSVARSLQISKVIVPIFPGQCSAFGTLIADVRIDRMWTQAYRSDNLDVSHVINAFDRLVMNVKSELTRSGYDGVPIIERFISMRYVEQNYEEDIPLIDGPISLETIERAYKDFHARHNLFYGYSFAEEILELVHFKVVGSGPAPKIELPEISVSENSHLPRHRPVYLIDHEMPIECEVLQRRHLTPDRHIHGPVIIEEDSSTTLVEPDFDLRVDRYGNLILTQGVEA
jgi:N-methylhydantoinase A